MKIGLQLYTLRDEMQQDFVGTLQKVAEIGYEGVEFAGYGGFAPDELAKVLKELGLTSVGSHVGVERLRHHLDEEIEMNVAIGSKYVVCPGIWEDERRSLAALSDVIAVFKEASRRFAENGIEFGYHNHAFEFTEQLGGKMLYELIFDLMGPVPMSVELDVCWVQHGGYDPIEYLMKYAGRTPLIHLKDLKTLPDGSPQTVILGEGEMELPEVIATAERAGVEWMIVEQDFCQIEPLESVAQSRQWLKSNGR